MRDPFDLDRFVQAQGRIYPFALAEIRHGAKRNHWMWFIFPQIAGLGHSDMAVRFAISSLDEARAYLAHPILGKRLVECVEALQNLPATSAEHVFGKTDAMKLRSSLTLFAEASGDRLFEEALARWFAGEDRSTLALLGKRDDSCEPVR